MTERDLEAVHAALIAQLAARGRARSTRSSTARTTRAPATAASPAPALFERAAREVDGVAIEGAVMIGDARERRRGRAPPRPDHGAVGERGRRRAGGGPRGRGPARGGPPAQWTFLSRARCSCFSTTCPISLRTFESPVALMWPVSRLCGSSSACPSRPAR